LLPGGNRVHRRQAKTITRIPIFRKNPSHTYWEEAGGIASEAVGIRIRRWSFLSTHSEASLCTNDCPARCEKFAQDNLFGPLGVEDFVWVSDAEGHLLGDSQLSLTPRNMAKIGLLYLNGGRLGDRQIVSES